MGPECGNERAKGARTDDGLPCVRNFGEKKQSTNGARTKPSAFYVGAQCGDQRHEDLLRQAAPVPMAVMTKEDIMKLPVAAAVHPRALERTLSEDKRNLLKDPFFRNNPPCDELQDLVVEAVPGADANVEARENFKREERNSRIRSRG
jgi:hypothetical protein